MTDTDQSTQSTPGYAQALEELDAILRELEGSDVDVDRLRESHPAHPVHVQRAEGLRVARLGMHLVGADAGCLVEPHEDGLWVLASSGRAPPKGFLAQTSGPAWETLRHGSIERGYGPMFDLPALWVPVREGERVVAGLGVGREQPFGQRDADLLGAFAAQVSFAWTFEQAQATVQRLQLIEDRERIGRDLHDTVIQRLFATGLSLQATVRRLDGQPDTAARVEQAVDDIDRTVKEIRSTIFALQSGDEEARGIRSRVLAVIDEVAPLLPRPPRVRFDGPIDTIVGDRTADQLIPVVREALTNVAKHAQAGDVEVELTADRDGVVLRVADDGRGIDPKAPRGLGLDNLDQRAADLGGTMTLGSGPTGRGTLLLWRVPG
jgi:signal transduction histidine kinase